MCGGQHEANGVESCFMGCMRSSLRPIGSGAVCIVDCRLCGWASEILCQSTCFVCQQYSLPSAHILVRCAQVGTVPCRQNCRITRARLCFRGDHTCSLQRIVLPMLFSFPSVADLCILLCLQLHCQLVPRVLPFRGHPLRWLMSQMPTRASVTPGRYSTAQENWTSA